MVIRSFPNNISLIGKDWGKAVEILKDKFGIFERQYDIFILCASIGIHDDQIKFIEKQDDENKLEITRSVFDRDIDDFQFLFRLAILTSKHLKLSSDERIEIAFGKNKENDIGELILSVDGKKMKAYRLLEPFANYGVKKLIDEVIDENYWQYNIVDLKNYLNELI